MRIERGPAVRYTNLILKQLELLYHCMRLTIDHGPEPNCSTVELRAPRSNQTAHSGRLMSYRVLHIVQASRLGNVVQVNHAY